MRRISLLLIVGMLAAILATSVFAADPVPTVVEGTITAISATTTTVGKISVVVPSPTPTTPTKLVTILVNAKTQIYRESKLVTLAALKVGDSCRASVITTAEGGLLAQIIYAAPPAALKSATGVIADKALWNGTRTFKLRIASTTTPMWFSVDASTKITVDGTAATYDKIANGQTAEVSYKQPPPLVTPVVLPILASTVSAKNPPPPVTHAYGKIVAVDPIKRTITVASLPTGSAPTVAAVFKVTDATTIDKFGPAVFANLTPAGFGFAGDQVDVAYKPIVTTSTEPPVAISILVSPEATIGTIVSVNPLAKTFVLSSGPSATSAVALFHVFAATKITRNGVAVGLGDLRYMDIANVKFFQFWSEKRASVVEAKPPVTGTVPPRGANLF